MSHKGTSAMGGFGVRACSYFVVFGTGKVAFLVVTFFPDPTSNCPKDAGLFPHSSSLLPSFAYPEVKICDSLAAIFYFDQQRCQLEMNPNESFAGSCTAPDIHQGFLSNPEYGHFEIWRKSYQMRIYLQKHGQPAPLSLSCLA